MNRNAHRTAARKKEYLLLNDVALLSEESLSFAVLFVDDARDLLVDDFVRLFRETLLIALLLGVVESSESRTHPIFSYKSTGDLGALLEIVRGTSRYLAEEELLCNAATKCHSDHVFKLLLRVQSELIR